MFYFRASICTKIARALPLNFNPAASRRLCYNNNVRNEVEFHKLSDKTLERIFDLTAELDNLNDDIEVNLSQGVLSINLGESFDNLTWVINKQTPNRQLWWSSPISGPRRYEWMPEEKSICINNLCKNNYSIDNKLNYIRGWKYSRAFSDGNTDGKVNIDSCNDLLSHLQSEILDVTGVNLIK